MPLRSQKEFLRDFPFSDPISQFQGQSSVTEDGKRHLETQLQCQQCFKSFKHKKDLKRHASFYCKQAKMTSGASKKEHDCMEMGKETKMGPLKEGLDLLFGI